MRRRSRWHQGEFFFLTRTRRLDRVFKAVILVVMLVAIVGFSIATPVGRRSMTRLDMAWKKGWNWALGAGSDRAGYETSRDRDRLLGIAQVRQALQEVVDERGPAMREFLHVAAMEHNSAVIRWGNVDQTLALSSKVFEPDDSGRSYRLLPNTRSVWLIRLTINKVLAMFEIPDTPEARRLGEAVGGQLVPESVQTTNSWGCRGPEPDRSALIRGLVLGDSNMQGLLVGDDQTPPFRLESVLAKECQRPVSVLNTGHLGYSPEQYYYTLLAYYDRFQPHFIVISICGNDFGDMREPANWTEGEYWLDAIVQYCRSRNVTFLMVPLPMEDTMLGYRDTSIYPGKVSRIFDGSGLNYLDPTEEFTTEHLRIRTQGIREGRPLPTFSALFNRKYQDNHMSPIGTDLWARIVAQRLRLIWALQDPSGLPIPMTRRKAAAPK